MTAPAQSLGDANDFLMGGGVTSAKFEKPGTTIAGKIVRPPEVQQQREINTGKPKFWDDGTPQKQLLVQVQTTLRDPQVPDDDGIRALYVRGNMLTAVRNAVRASGTQLAAGGHLSVTYTGDGERSKPGFNPPKLYEATYSPASQSAVNDMLGDDAGARPQPPAARNLPPGITEEMLAGMGAEQKKALSVLYPSFPPF